MATIELLDLPDIILAKILSYLPDRFEIASVCRKFYDLICEIERNKMTIVLGGYKYDQAAYVSVINSQRVCSGLHTFTPIKTQQDYESLKTVFQHHGASIKKLQWSNWEKYAFSEESLIELLNYLPNLEKIQLSSWFNEIPQDSKNENEKLQLTKLKKISLKSCGSSIAKFLTKFLPKDIIQTLKLYETRIPMNDLKNLIQNQKSIKDFDAEGEFEDGSILDCLKLTNLRIHIETEMEVDQNPPRRLALKKMIESQPNLKFLDILDDSDYFYKIADDEIFLKICKIKSLETLKLNLSGIDDACISNFKNLTNLKNFETLTCTVEAAMDAFAEMSLIKTVPLERLEMRLWDVDLPAEIFQQFGQNYKFLKHLEIKLGTWHKLNFFMKSFPGLETLKIRFGEANRNVTFSEAYEDDGFVHEKIKNLALEIYEEERINTELFSKMLKSFPNLEKFNMQSEIPYVDEFFVGLSENIRKIKELRLSRFTVDPDIEFSEEFVQILRSFTKILKFVEFDICSIDDSFFGEPKGGRTKADFKPLIDELADIYKIKQTGITTNVDTYTLYLEFGKSSD